MSSRTDKVLRVLTGLTVAGLAIVAGAISFAHMTELAMKHDQTGWKAYAFPVSVDGLEIVASLYLVVQRRAGRPRAGFRGWRSWSAPWRASRLTSRLAVTTRSVRACWQRVSGGVA